MSSRKTAATRSRRRLLLAGVGSPALLGLPATQACAASAAGSAKKVLRVAFPFAETGFDPVQIGDESSFAVCNAIFEAPLRFDYLARPAKVVPGTCAMPEVSADFRRWTFTIKPGIFFSDDPVFKGRRRELVAQDYVYVVKRHYDPKVITERLFVWENAKLLGLSELRKQVVANKTPFPYDQEVEGIRALDRYRFEFRLAEPLPRFHLDVASAIALPGMAREVLEAYAADPMAHPVGTGPFKLVQWRRSSFVALERNPNYREVIFDSVAPEGDAEALAVEQHLKGKRLPLLDRIEVSVIDESQPRWLAFQGGQLDMLNLPAQFVPQAAPNGKLSPRLRREGVRLQPAVSPGISHTFFNCNDPVVGGNSPEKVALRRAVAMGYDNRNDVAIVFNGMAVPAQSMMTPYAYGFDESLRSEMDRSDPARARALLDLYGYLDRDGDGYRELPDGKPLTLKLASTQDQRARFVNDLWRKRMAAIGVRMEFEQSTFGELIRRSLAGKLQMWGFGWGGSPDGDFVLGLAYGGNIDQSNDSRFALPAYDRLYEQQRRMPDGPERLGIMAKLIRMQLAYMPYIPHYHVMTLDLVRPHVRGVLRHPFVTDLRWMHADIV
jgi:ABC-type transport system substrate-binding protein